MWRKACLIVTLSLCCAPCDVSSQETQRRPGTRDFDDIRSVPWGDIDYRCGSEVYRFTSGVYESNPDPGNPQTFEFRISLRREVVYGDIDGDDRDEAVVPYVSWLGGAAHYLYATAFDLQDGKLVCLAHLERGDRGAGGIRSVAIRNGRVEVQRFDTDGGLNHPDRLLVELWKFDDGDFVKEKVLARKRREPRPWHMRRTDPGYARWKTKFQSDAGR